MNNHKGLPLTAADFNPIEPICNCCEVHHQRAPEEWFLAAFPVPIPAALAAQYLELLRHWQRNIERHYEEQLRVVPDA